MTTPGRHISEEASDFSSRVTAADVHGVLFTRSGLGRRGYDETEVDEFLDRVQAEIQRLTAEKSDLRDEVTRLRLQLERAGTAKPDGPTQEEAAIQAVGILSAAQQTADQYVADAEHYSRRLSSDAREHSEALMVEARMRAARIIGDAERAAEMAADDVRAGVASESGMTKDELEEQVAYLRTFGQVCRTQLRSYLEALLQDVEIEWGKANPAVALSAPPVPRQITTPSPSEDGDAAGEAEDLREVVLNGHARAGVE